MPRCLDRSQQLLHVLNRPETLLDETLDMDSPHGPGVVLHPQPSPAAAARGGDGAAGGGLTMGGRGNAGGFVAATEQVVDLLVVDL